MAHRDPHSAASDQPIPSITTAQAAHSEGLDARMKRYALQMGLRIVCIIVAVVADGWVRWAAVVGAVVLPWVAVVLANGTDRADVKDMSFMTEPAPPSLDPVDTARHPQTEDDDVIEGEFTEGTASSPGDRHHGNGA